MAKFSSVERMVAAMLSATPVLKKGIKKSYLFINSLIYKKNYRFKILDERISEVRKVFADDADESFFGYYDKNPDSDDKVIGHLALSQTCKAPSADQPVLVVVKNLLNGKTDVVDETYAYNWQQGARSQWLNDDLIIYNAFERGIYMAKVYSVGAGRTVKSFEYPVQDSFGTSYFLSLNYRRLMRLRPDYGYRNLPPLENDSMTKLRDDGIWKVDYATGSAEMVWSLEDITDLEYNPLFDACLHKVNHIMVNKTGDAFVFIHRFYDGYRRFDRLIYSDFKTMKVLADDQMVSHCCWVDDNTVLGYFRYKGQDGYYTCNVRTGKIIPCLEMTRLQVGDGHPSVWGDWIVFDSYPDKSRMQYLYMYDRRHDRAVPLLELYHSIGYTGECRCDLHPRFSQDGKKVFFDSVYDGRRRLCYVDVSSITQN